MTRVAQPGDAALYGPYHGRMSDAAVSVRTEDEPSWDDVVRHAEQGETVGVNAHGEHVADIVPSGELDRLYETISILSDPEAAQGLKEGLEDIRAGRIVPASDVAADLAARRASGE